jgi:hypothetical protein
MKTTPGNQAILLATRMDHDGQAGATNLPRSQNLGAGSPTSLKINIDRLAGMLSITTIDASSIN